MVDARVLGSLQPTRVIAIGESQSAVFLTTYVNAIDPLAKVYDGFLIHSRFGNAASLEDASMAAPSGQPAIVKFRPDLRAPGTKKQETAKRSRHDHGLA